MSYPYKFFCMGRMLIDKSIAYINRATPEEYEKTIRIYSINRGITGSLYDLTYDATYIDNNLYLGNSYNARNYYDLCDKNIGLIVNCTEEIPNYFDDYFKYHNIDIKDINGANILPFLDNSVDTIHKFINENPSKSVFVHCFMGSSRSATIVIAYLMKYKNTRLKDALQIVKDKRCVVNLNIDFFRQLRKFQDKLDNIY